MKIFFGFQEVHPSSTIFLQGTYYIDYTKVANKYPQFNFRKRYYYAERKTNKNQVDCEIFLLYRFFLLNWNSWQII